MDLKNEEEKIDNYEGLKKIALIIKEERDEKNERIKKMEQILDEERKEKNELIKKLIDGKKEKIPEEKINNMKLI